MPKILLVGQDLRLLQTRAKVLEKIGAEVVVCEGGQTLSRVVAEHPDLVVLCHSLDGTTAEELAERVRDYAPTTKTLLLVAYVHGDEQIGDTRFDAISGSEPTRLIRRTTELLKIPLPVFKENCAGRVAH